MKKALIEGALAIHGGTPARTRPNPPMFPGGMAMGEEEERALVEVVRSHRLFRYYGPTEAPSKVDAFERAFAEVTGTRFALATSSCTGAISASLVAAGIGPGDEVIVPAYTFVASAAAVVAANAIPVITEVDDTLTLDPEAVERNITPSTRAIMPVHMRGAACQMDALMEIARRHGLKVIEDAAQANGGSYKECPLGAIGDAGCFSMQFHKIITSGEGGVITTDDRDLYLRTQSYHDTGNNWRASLDIPSPFPGVNLRMTEMCGALGLVQLGRRAGLLARMRALKKRIKEEIGDIPGLQFRRLADAAGDAAVCLIFFLPDKNTALKVSEALHAEGIGAGTMGSKEVPDWHVYIHWHHILGKHGNNDKGCPFNCHHYRGAVRYDPDMCPRTLDYLRRYIHLDINPLFTDEDADEIARGLRKVLSAML